MHSKVVPKTEGGRLFFTESLGSSGLTPPEELTLSITSECNLHCRHCWPECGPGEKNTPVPYEYLQHVISQWHDAGLRSICLTGGEPFTHPNWKNILSYCCGLPGFTSVRLQSNGTMFDPQTVHLLARPEYRKILLQVSLDGSSAATHDSIRGRGNFSLTMKGLKLLQSNGLASRTTIAFTETAGNFSQLPEMLHLVEQLGLARLVSGTLIIAGRAAQSSHIQQPSPHQYTDLVSRFVKDEQFRDIYLKYGVVAAIEWFRHRDMPGQSGACSCMATPYINAHGSLYPCTLLWHEQFAIDRVWTRSLASVIEEIHERWTALCEVKNGRPSAIPECKECLGRDHCQGGCLGRSLSQTGNCFLPEDRCPHRKSIYSWNRES